ncbi:hypothetical protein HGP16_25540 [Rhizobium sp. P40RR-XXII]|uniref:hypothetical protein n=1 Tax=Rhizobium sp. P40RR-XXII TaxID=2726739 RepID=UPI001456419E|nr:hypothetical protein [Rhizobium sp. P40RR-XXII]NLS19906.1 hypothetical protein [Rhizobium sp. P40RR-XXII]
MAALAAIGTLVSAVGTVASGVAAKKDSDFQAQQLDAKAKEEMASSQREAAQSKQQATLANSRAQAIAAASGGGASTDAPTIVKLMSDTAGQGQLNADAQLYNGYSRAAGFTDQAAATRRTGRASLLGSIFNGFGQAAGGISKGVTSGAFG